LQINKKKIQHHCHFVLFVFFYVKSGGEKERGFFGRV